MAFPRTLIRTKVLFMLNTFIGRDWNPERQKPVVLSCDVNAKFNIQQDSNLVGYNNRKLPPVFI